MVSDRCRSGDPPVIVDDGGMTKLIGLAFALFAVFGLLYLFLHSIEWSALITLVFIVTPGVVYLVTWIRVKDHQMNMDKARLAFEAQIQSASQPAQAPPFRAQLGSGKPEKTTWAPSFTSKPRMVTDYDRAGNRMDVSYQHLQHFIETQFPSPNRERFWRMTKEDYGSVAHFLCEIDNAPLQYSGNTFVWTPGINQEDMREWLKGVSAPPAHGGVSLTDEVME
jgi:hypothetical protein